MRKIDWPLYAAIAVIGLFAACIYSPEDVHKTPKDQPSGNITPYVAYYRLRVVNNTGDAVVLYDHSYFSKNDVSGYTYTSAPGNELCTVAGGEEKTGEFFWSPVHTLYYSDDPDVPILPAEEIQKQFEPETRSFYLTLGINGELYYLVGWPETIELPAVNDPKDPWNITLPRDKIVQYGIGYGENREVRIKDYAYLPFIIKYAGQTQEYDFDDVNFVYGDAVLTINSATDIHFETLGLGLEPFEYSPF